jgi:hypothetical protein
MSEPEVKNFITTWIKTERKNLDTMAPEFLSPSDSLTRGFAND